MLIFILFALVMTSSVFVFSEYEKQIGKTENKIDGVVFAKKVQYLIVEIQRLRGYSQFTEELITDSEQKEIALAKKQINLSLQQNVVELKQFKALFPNLYDDQYDHILDSLQALNQKKGMAPAELFQNYTHLIAQLKERLYHLGTTSELLFEEEAESYYLMDILFDHLPNYIESIARTRGAGSRCFLQKKAAQNLKDFINKSRFISVNEKNEIKKIVDLMSDQDEKRTLSGMLADIEADRSEVDKQIVKVLDGEEIETTALTFFRKATAVIDLSMDFYETGNAYLLKKLQLREKKLNVRKQYGEIAVVLFVLLLWTILYFMVRNTLMLTKREKAAKKELISTNNLKTVLMRCNTLDEISLKSLAFLAEKFDAIRGVIYLYSEENDKLYLSATYATKDAESIVEMGEGAIGEAALKKERVFRLFSEHAPQVTATQRSMVTAGSVCAFPLVSSDHLVAVVQLGFLTDKQNGYFDEVAHFTDIITGFLRDAMYEQKNRRQLELLNKNVMTSKTNKEGWITDVSELFASTSGYAKEELIGNSHNILRHPDTPTEAYKELWTSILSGKVWKGEMKNRKKDGNEYWVEAVITPDRDKNENILGSSAIFHDITNKKRVEKLSITDALTGLYNRRYFDIVFPRVFKSVKREKSSMVFLMMDIDFFKQYNDTYGHKKGDEALKSVAKVMNEQFKRPDDYLFRLGGEEFGALYYSNNLENAYKMAERVKQQVEQLEINHEQNSASPYLTISIGLFFIPTDCHFIDLDEIYKAADDALYKAKESGRNRIEVVDIAIC